MQSVTVQITDKAAIHVNFTLKMDEYQNQWSSVKDFDIKKNMKTEYVNTHDIQNEFRDIALLHPDFVSFDTLHMNRKGKAVSLIHLSGEVSRQGDHKPRVLLLGNVHGDEPVGTEMLVRLVRHLVTGRNNFSFKTPVVELCLSYFDQVQLLIKWKLERTI